jgi:hypothetical protein
MKIRVTLIAALVLLPAVLSGGQAPSAGAPSVPDKLLDGIADFSFALQLFSDIRGNVGPCG